MKLSAFVKLAKREIAKYEAGHLPQTTLYVWDGTGPKPPSTFMRGVDDPTPDGIFVVRTKPLEKDE